VKKIRIALAQINPVVGDLSGNVKKIVSYIKEARILGVDIIAFPELIITGYPPEDLVLTPQFINDNIDGLNEVIAASNDITAVVGFIDRSDSLFNAAAVISDGRLVDVYHKKHLPNYGVFDEYRYFQSGKRYPVYNLTGINIGINICEDIWYEKGPAKVQALSGAEIIININASPYHVGKALIRENVVSARALECRAAIIYVNMVGGQDELVFDGGSFAVNSKGEVIIRGKQFKEELFAADINVRNAKDKFSGKEQKELKALVQKGEIIERIRIPSGLMKKRKPELEMKKNVMMPHVEEVYNALLLGTKDYVHKNGFNNVVIGLSGGIDSALVATIAVDAIGKEYVHGLFMPSRFTSRESYEDVAALCKNLKIKTVTIPITDIYKSYLKTLSKNFKGTKTDIAEENLQARIRGNLLMAFSNKFGWLVLTTGNKSEMSVGYATLYGDMAGGFAVIKDVPKTMVYDLCKWKNEKEGSIVIPERILWKEPTAELKPDQRDTDTLPPYPVLDSVLKAYVEEHKSIEEIRSEGCDAECVNRVIKMVDRSEYKRRQSPPGIKITPRAFGKDWRFPITNRYKSY